MKYTVRLERYTQEYQEIEVLAPTVEAALEIAHEVNPAEIGWAWDCDVGDPRIYGIRKSKERDYLREIDLDDLHDGLNAWICCSL